MPISRDQLRFDGVMVDRQEAKFSGTFDVEAEEQEEILMDAYVMVVTVARCGPATIRPIEKTGDRVRVDTLKLADACIVVDEDLRDVLVDKLGLIWPEKLALEEIEHLGKDKKRLADVTTGEIAAPEGEQEPEAEPEPKKKATKAKKATKKAAAKSKEPEPEPDPEDLESEEDEDEDEWEDVPPPPPPRSGVVGDARSPARQDRSIREGDVFNPATSGERELVGQISGTKDSLLAKFMDTPG